MVDSSLESALTISATVRWELVWEENQHLNKKTISMIADDL